MRRFYELYQNALGDRFSLETSAQAVPELTADSDHVIGAQAVHQISLYELSMVPWGHHRQIIINSKGNVDKAIFFVRKVIENNWSRGVLMNFLDTDLYERTGKAINNFHSTLPKPHSDLAQEMTRDPYNFDFIAIRENYDEKELKDALMNQVQDFLMELGTGLSFVGREYRLVVGETEQFIDMLFYNIQEHCYVVVEVKVVDFEPSFIGQLGTYIVAVDRILRKDNNKTVGLLICKTKDNVLAQYATDSSTEPIGVSQYKLTHLLPAEYRRSMPTIEEIEQELSVHPMVEDSLVLDRGGKIFALVYPKSGVAPHIEKEEDLNAFCEEIRNATNKLLPAFSQIFRVELVDVPFERTAKGTIKRHLYQ